MHDSPCSRRGLTLLELIFTSAMMAGVLVGAAMLLRTGHVAWEAHEADYTRLHEAQAVVRHLVRNIRQADSVVAISAASQTSGTLSLLMPTGETYAWAHDNAASPKQVKFGVTTASDLLAESIDELTFTAYEKDGVTATTTPADIHSIVCAAKVTLPRNPPITRTVSSWAWIRTW